MSPNRSCSNCPRRPPAALISDDAGRHLSVQRQKLLGAIPLMAVIYLLLVQVVKAWFSAVRIAASQDQNNHMEPFIFSESIQIEVLSKKSRSATES